MEQYHCECILFYSYFDLHLTPMVAMFNTWSWSSLPPLSIQDIYSYQATMIYTHLKSITTQNFGHSLKIFLVLSMAVTSNAPLLPIHMVYIKIGKYFFSQNCLFASSFNMYFAYLLCGWEGAASNVRVFADAKAHDFIVLPGKYYLADAGFPVCDELLTPYHAVYL
jgi:hypothetical protein